MTASTNYPPGTDAKDTTIRPFFRLFVRTVTEPPADITLILLVGVILIATGLWAYLAPLSFFQVVAPYPPYNEHLFHDIGAFLAGLGTALVLAVRIQDGPTIALVANAVAATLHAFGHVEDRNLGGYPTDPWLLSVFALVVLVLAVRRVRQMKRLIKQP